MRVGNFCFGCGWYKTRIWTLIPTIELHFMGDEIIFTKGSWNIVVTWLKEFVEFGYIKLKEQ